MNPTIADMRSITAAAVRSQQRLNAALGMLTRIGEEGSFIDVLIRDAMTCCDVIACTSEEILSRELLTESVQ